MAPPPNPELEMQVLDLFPLQEPVSRRSYTCIRLRTRSGAVGFGECASITLADLTTLRRAISRTEASSFEEYPPRLTVAPAAMAALNMAMLDIFGKFTKAPVYQVLGGPTRNQARALAQIEGSTDDEITATVAKARAGGYRAFAIPVPSTHAPNHSATLVAATRRLLDKVRDAAGEGCDFVLDAGGRLTPGDAIQSCRCG